jgi:hypothetical protein
MGFTMTKSILALAAATLGLAALTCSPASAAMTCSGDDMMKANNMVGAMVDSPNKMMMTKEIGMANTAMSQGKMRECSMHMRKVEHMGMMKSGM